ncbi:hypothetical protein C8039_15635 [Halogeometricum sp. wsp3]|nr:hypothetical protein C8039_15635 [Halogeometricum sp. wsp3]
MTDWLTVGRVVDPDRRVPRCRPRERPFPRKANAGSPVITRKAIRKASVEKRLMGNTSPKSVFIRHRDCGKTR